MKQKTFERMLYILLIYVLVGAFLFFYQRKLLYFPTPIISHNYESAVVVHNYAKLLVLENRGVFSDRKTKMLRQAHKLIKYKAFFQMFFASLIWRF
jgi:hypothetical protein